MSKLNSFNSIDSYTISKAVNSYPTPFYLYDQALLIAKCQELLNLPQAFGLKVRYAMKANSTKALLKIISDQGLLIDASSLTEVRRAYLAGIPHKNILLTSQEVPHKQDLQDLQSFIKEGLEYNVCSLQQLFNIGDFIAINKIPLSIRLHPGLGSGESATRNTAAAYASFGINEVALNTALDYTQQRNIKFNRVHVHIGSGTQSEFWKNNVDRELMLLEKYFPEATIINFGGGFKEGRMPDEQAADILALANYAKEALVNFQQKTNRQLQMEIEPGNYLMANAGFIITSVIDKKQSEDETYNFLILDGGMDLNTRPLLYGSQHPFYVITKNGELLYSEFENTTKATYQAVIVGKCCETGDSQCLNEAGINTPRLLVEPEIGDIVAIGGCGAYCSSMSLANYNSNLQASELLYTTNGELKEIRRKQNLQQLVANEL